MTPIEVQRLVTADLEGGVSNAQLQLLRSEHPVELTNMLQGLATRGFPDQVGQKRGCLYRLQVWAMALVPGRYVGAAEQEDDGEHLRLAEN